MIVVKLRPQKQGTTFKARRFQIKSTIEGVTAPKDITGAAITINLKSSIASKVLTIGSGLTVIDAPNGIFQIDSFLMALSPNNYKSEVVITEAGGYVYIPFELFLCVTQTI